MVSPIALLILKYNRGELSNSEQAELDNWIAQSEDNARLFAELTDPESVRFQVGKMDSYNEALIRGKIEMQEPYAFVQKTKVRKIRYLVGVAAAVLILMGSGLYVYLNNGALQNKPNESKNQIIAKDTRDISAPKNNRASITLANGQKIFLDSAANGTIATQRNIAIKKNGDGVIAYSGKAAPKAEMQYNLLTNPRGSKIIDITLSDGTQVWLNAESSIKYPVAFIGNDREVEITGEAYFEVKHDASKPFKVKTKNSTIEDIGTAFNVNAYEDEAAEKITLIQGAVEVSATAGTKTANPFASQTKLTQGEQAFVEAGGLTLNKRPDLEEVLAWKNGLFDFHNADIKAIMQQLSRWYDVQVSYEGKTTNETYNGEIGRTLSLKDVMDGLAFTHVKFRIEEGRKLVILP